MVFNTIPKNLVSGFSFFGQSFFRVTADIPSKTHGIYFIIEAGEVVYVGRSTNVSARVRESLRRVNCETAFYVKLIPSDIYRNEKRYIRKLQPIFNRKHVKGRRSSGRKPKYTV